MATYIAFRQASRAETCDDFLGREKERFKRDGLVLDAADHCRLRRIALGLKLQNVPDGLVVRNAGLCVR